MPAPAQVIQLREEQIPAAAAAMAQAFHADPLQTYVFPDPDERTRLSPAHFASFLRYGMIFGEVLTNAGTPKGASIWLGPEDWEVTPDRAAAAGLDALPHTIGHDAAARFFSTLGAVEPFHKRDMPTPHFYLMILGVAPEAQGTGLGRALVQPVLERADALRLPCYLETAQPSNVSFYQHLGFTPLVETVDAHSGLRLWTFRREPSEAT